MSPLTVFEPLRLPRPESAFDSVIEFMRGEGGENPDHIAELATVLADSGNRLSFDRTLIADIPSTGAPSSLSTLIGPLFLSAAGVCVPKVGVPGRPAGGIDCMAQIRGYRYELSPTEVESVVGKCGYAHFVAGEFIAPLDAKFFQHRQKIGAQSIAALASASILAKKLAVGVRTIALDVRVGPHGNFGHTWEAAKRHARIFSAAASVLGIEAIPVLTDAKFLYQPYLGRRESLVALSEFFSGRECSWLQEHVALCRNLALTCIPRERRPELMAMERESLARVFTENVMAQGGSIEHFFELVEETKATHSINVCAQRDGYFGFAIERLRDAIVQAQAMAGGFSADPIGVRFVVKPGTWVSNGTPLATIRAESEFLDAAASIAGIIGSTLDFPWGPGVETVYGQ